MAPRGGFNGAGGTRGGRGSSSTHSSSGGVSASVGGLSLGSSGGEDQVSSSIAHREGLQQLWIDGVTLMPSGSISTVIRDSFKTYMSHEGFTWRLVPDNAKEIYFDEFKKSFYWDPAIDKQVYDKWMEKASERYRGLIYRIKRQRNQNRPPYIPGNIWPAWLAYWESEEVQEKARIAKKNRLTEPDGPGTGIAKHRGGSRCAQQHSLALSKEKGIPINNIDWDLFMRFHFVNGEFTDPRSAKIAEEVHAIAKEQSQPLPGTTEPLEVNMTAIYLDVVGVSKKNRVFGIGCRSRKYTKCGSRASSSQDLGVASEEKIKAAVDAQLQMRLDAQRVEMQQEIQAQMQAQVEAQVQSQVQVQLQAHLEEQKKVFEQMLAQFKSGSGHSPPS